MTPGERLQLVVDIICMKKAIKFFRFSSKQISLH